MTSPKGHSLSILFDAPVSPFEPHTHTLLWWNPTTRLYFAGSCARRSLSYLYALSFSYVSASRARPFDRARWTRSGKTSSKKPKSVIIRVGKLVYENNAQKLYAVEILYFMGEITSICAYSSGMWILKYTLRGKRKKKLLPRIYFTNHDNWLSIL